MSEFQTSLRRESIEYTPELKGLKLLLGINLFLLVSAIVMPQYFGVNIGYDITCTRFANLLLIAYALVNYRVFNTFARMVVKVSVFIPLTCYLLVTMYTMVLRVDINAFVMPFLEILTFFMLIFAIRYLIGVRRAIDIINKCSLFLSIYGVFEFATGRSWYMKLLKTLPSAVGNVVRSGYYRITGPCGHPLGYGLLLILLIAVACIDYEKDEVYFFKHPALILLLYLNVFLTGSRSSLGIAILEAIIIIAMSEKDNRVRATFYLVLLLLAFAAFLLVAGKTKIGNYFLMQIAMLIDHVLGTTYAENFGAQVQRLEDSAEYRKCLPKIFTLDWLNPFLGRGLKRSFAAEIVGDDGKTYYLISIDNYYISQYIKYAYPGLISYAIFVLVSGITMIRSIIKYKSPVMKMLFVGFACYFLNLWWLDALQTLKFVYIILAIFFAQLLYFKDGVKNKESVTAAKSSNE